MSGCSGDHVGADSCIDLRTSEEFELYMQECKMSCELSRNSGGLESVGRSRVVRRKEPRALPPPPLPRLPWTMKRYRTSDGRLIIRKEKVVHCEYLRAHRCDGRLVLRLVSVDNVDCHGQESDVDEEDEAEGCSDGADLGFSSSLASLCQIEVSSLHVPGNVYKGVLSGEKGSPSGGGGSKCLTSASAALTGACLTCS